MTVQTRKDGVTRRDFLIGSAAAGTGLVMGFSVLPRLAGSASQAIAAGNYEPSLFITMEANGRTTVHITKAEMGQHVGTALAQSVAEELEVDWNDVRVDYPSSDEKWGLMITGGSWSVNWTFDQLSRAGASGRIALIETAAKAMGVPVSECMAKQSKVIHGPTGQSMTYAEILSTQTIDRTFSEDDLKAIELKKFGTYSVVGKPVQQLDIPAKTNGTAGYGIDVFVPNMLYGTWVNPPVRWGAKAKGFNDSAAKNIPGYVKAVMVEDPTQVQMNYVIALAETFDASRRAAEAIKVDWDMGPNADVNSEGILQHAKSLTDDPNTGFAWVLEGDVDANMSGTTHDAEYITSLTYHGMMEPMNCTAQEAGGVMHLYTGCQWQTRCVAMVAEALGMEPANVVIHQQYLGGGFGRRLEPDAMLPAALAAKAAGRPVKLVYSREQDVWFDFHRSITYQRMSGAVEGGKLKSVKQDVCSGWATKRQAPGFLAESVDKKGRIDPFSMNGSDFWYTVPNHYVRAIENDLAQSATPPGQLRSVAPAWTFWAVESFIDEIAHKAGVDPVDMRIAMLDAAGKNAGTPPNSVGGAKRLRNVLEIAVGRAGYGVKPMGEDEGMGVAAVSSQERGSPTWTACVAHVKVDRGSGEVTVKKLTVVMDLGTLVNPDGVMQQVQGSTLWGLSHSLMERATMENGMIVQSNFDTYTPLRINQVPDMDITLVQNGHYPSGCGEPAVTVVPPAMANAIFNAVGARVRELPMTPEKVKAALGEA
ncbi:MAG: aldehyde dehydrogenase [Rhodospirillaceae bacterium]|nr:aldehyde dehydrogenase [Rhodospirillaceae bacterium]|tara:strand:- start:585 stop:2867 length:2283 start_codon:yes stop_codon:yes gene_type:complete